MTRQRALQAVPTSTEHTHGDTHVVHRPRQLKGWRTVKQLTEELCFPSEKACRSWLARQGVASVRRGRVILVDGLDIDRKLRSA